MMVFLPGIPSTRRFAKAQNLQSNRMRRVRPFVFHGWSHHRAQLWPPKDRGGRGGGGGELGFAQEEGMKELLLLVPPEP